MFIGTLTPRPATIEELLPPQLAAKVDRLDLLSRKLLAGKLPGERRSKRRGRSVEFDDFRNYVAGDDLRHIDWNVYARFDRLFVKLFREEEDLALHLAVDASGSMNAGNPNKLMFSHQLAMSLAYIGLVNQNRVSIAAIGRSGGRDGVRQLSPMRGRSSLKRAADFLLESFDAVDSPVRVDLNASLRAIAMNRAGRGITVVISDYLTDGSWQTGLNALASGGAGGGAVDAFCLQVLSPGEVDPSIETALVGDLRMTDVETGRDAEVTISGALLNKYRAAVESYIGRLREDCRARGIGHFLVRTDMAIEQLVMGSLRRGGMLR